MSERTPQPGPSAQPTQFPQQSGQPRLYPNPQHIGAPERRHRDEVGLTALSLGVVGLLLCWIPFVGYVSVVLGAVGIALTAIGLVNNRQGIANNPVTALLSALTCVAAIVLPWIFLAS